MRKITSVAIIVLFMISCAASTVRWSSGRASLKKGQSGDTVLQLLGDPYRRYTDADQNEVWEYRKPAESRTGVNTFVGVATFGMESGANSWYADILNVKLKENKLVGFTYQENVTTVTEPSMKSNNSQSGTAATTSLQEEPADAATGQNLLVTKKASNIRAENNTKSKIIVTLRPNEKLENIGQSGNWYQVRTSSGETGWISKDLVKEAE